MSEPSSPTPPSRKNYAWIGYFAFLLVASVGVTAFMIWFNYRVQLKPEQLEAARELWKQSGPKSYNMIYTKEIGTGGRKETFVVKVRNRIVEEVRMNEKPLVANSDGEQENDPRIYHSMDNFYRDLMKFMECDQKPDAKKVYVTANFDEKTGAVLRYIRYVMGTPDRVELNITLEAVQD